MTARSHCLQGRIKKWRAIDAGVAHGTDPLFFMHLVGNVSVLTPLVIEIV